MATFKFQNKFACAAYFNMARDNFHRTMLDIFQQIGITDNYIETELDARMAEMLAVLKGQDSAMNAGNARKLKAQQPRVRQQLFQHFPILGPVMSEILKQRHINKDKAAWDALLEEEQKKILAIEDVKERNRKRAALVNDDGDRDATCADCFDAIYTLGCCLSDCRKFFTHYQPYNSQDELQEIYTRQKQIAAWLFPVFTASRRLDKKRNRLTSAEMAFITNNNYKVKTDEAGKKVQNEEKKDVYIKNHDYYFSILGESFVSLNADGSFSQDSLENDGTHADFGKAANYALSDFGLLYLCCSFITRPQAKLFADKVSLFANSPENMTDANFRYVLSASNTENPSSVMVEEMNRLKIKLGVENLDLSKEEDLEKFNALRADTTYWQKTPENLIIQEMLSIYRVRLPKGKRLDKQDNASTIALDMLNELRRCPRELYNILSPKGQKAFEDPADDGSGSHSAKNDRIRYTDRFAYLALRAIDEAKIFNSIRFQVQLGYYRFAFYDKTCIDETPQLRRLGKTVNGFGRLSAIENLRKQSWAPTDAEPVVQEENKFQCKVYEPTQLEDGRTVLDLLRPVEDEVGNTPYVTDSAASYNIHNNRIGLYWERDGNRRLRQDDVLFFPTLQAKDIEGKSEGHRKADAPQKAPLCSLSVRDLPALLFLYHLNGGNKQAVENVIINKYDSLLRFFTDLSRIPQEGGAEPTFESIRKEVKRIGLDEVLKDYGLKASEIPTRLCVCFVPDGETQPIEAGPTDILGYFKDLLEGSKYALDDNATLDSIKQLIHNVGYEKATKGLPSKLKKQVNPQLVTQTGIETLLRCKGRKTEDAPANIMNFVFDEVEIIAEPDENAPNPVTLRFIQKLIGRVEKRRAWIDSQLKKLKVSRQQQFVKDNRYATKGYKDVRYGRLAQILAESMLKWQPSAESERGKDKLTGLNYRRLTDFLSTYNEKSVAGEWRGLDALKHVLRKAKLIDSPNAHPFLATVLKKNPKHIEALFQDYMYAEKSELINVEGKFSGFDKKRPVADAVAIAPAFVHPNRKRWQDDCAQADNVRDMAKRYIEDCKTLLLPDGLFADAIIEQMKNAGMTDILDEAEDKNQENNVSFLISRYMESKDDHCQSFYDGNTEQFYRGYDLFKKLEGKKQGNEQLPQYLSREEIAKKLKEKASLEKSIANYCERKNKPEAKEGMIRDISRIRKNERAILRYKIQDMVLFLTAKKMLESLNAVQDGSHANDEAIHRVPLGKLTLRAIDRRLQFAQEHQEQQISQMKLKDIFDGSALDITLNYEYMTKVTWHLLDEQGNKVTREETRRVKGKEVKVNVPVIAERRVYITQENVAAKNFGRIFRIIKDVRLKDLLLLLIEKREGGRTHETGPDYTVSAAELANDFAKLDSWRPDAFEIIHRLEKAAYGSLKHPESEESYQFKNMMRLITDEQEADGINQYRVAFAHSKYAVEARLFGSETSLQAPEVSEAMETQLRNRSETILGRAGSQETTEE